MKHLTITCLLVSAALLGGAAHSNACTSIIVSGKVTPDGRPYIFKNRDTHDLDNLAIQIQGPRYRFIGIVATKDTLYKSVWSGHNEVGFAIANTAAYNLNDEPEPGKPRPQGDDNDGILMRKALGTCRTLGDFEHLLDSIKAQGPIPSNSNIVTGQARCDAGVLTPLTTEPGGASRSSISSINCWHQTGITLFKIDIPHLSDAKCRADGISHFSFSPYLCSRNFCHCEIVY